MKLLVIGSGPTGVHFSLSALRKGHQVTMLDVGTPRPAMALPDETFIGLKTQLPDPARYFLGEGFEAAMLPTADRSSEYYGFPPSKDYVFRPPEQFRYEGHGFSPLISFAKGGLAEAWTAGCYAFNDAELSEFPFDYAEIKPHYDEVAHRIGVAGEDDDLGLHLPRHDNLLRPTALDENSDRLYARYRGRREALIRKHGIRMGRSRQAVLTEDRDGRGGCRYCGRCLWGCPNGAFYTPSLSLGACTANSNFTYRPGYFASHFLLGSDSSIEHLVAYGLSGGGEETFRADAYVLACGTLSTGNLVLRSIYKTTGEIVRLPGLMDNRQVFAPFLNLAMLGRTYSPDTYQYHQLAVGIGAERTAEYVHGQITALKTATAHPIIQSLPFDLRSASDIFTEVRSGLGVLSLFFHDRRRDDNYLTLEHAAGDRAREEWPVLSIRYAPAREEARAIETVLARMRRFFMALGAPIVPGMTKIRAAGGGVHYSGTLPMRRDKAPWSLSKTCQSYDIANMFVVDGSAMPFLPAKNLTFTLMANASRVGNSI